MKPGSFITQVAPWSGLFAGAAAWFVDQRASADASFWDCTKVGTPWTFAVGLLCLAVTAAGGLMSWRSRAAPDTRNAQVRRFGGTVGFVSAGIFALAILIGMLAGAILPACER